MQTLPVEGWDRGWKSTDPTPPPDDSEKICELLIPYGSDRNLHKDKNKGNQSKSRNKG
jgi:hypothetical protein